MTPHPGESPKPGYSITENQAVNITVECTGGIESDLPLPNSSHRDPVYRAPQIPTTDSRDAIHVFVEVTDKLIFRPRPKPPAAPSPSDGKPAEGDKPAT